MVQKLRSCKEADFWLEGPADDSEIAEPCLPKDAGAGDWNPGLAAGVTGAACFETACSFSASRRAFAAWAGESHGCKYCNVNCVHLYPCYLQVTILINQIEAWKHQGYHHRIASSHWLSSASAKKELPRISVLHDQERCGSMVPLSTRILNHCKSNMVCTS